MKIRDMAKCLEEFEQLCRAFLKSKNIVDKEGVPPFYIRLLADLEDYLNQVRTLYGVCVLSAAKVYLSSLTVPYTMLVCQLKLFKAVQLINSHLTLSALGGQRGQEENE